MGNAQMGAETEVMHDVQTGCMDNAQTGAMTDVSHKLRTGCTDDAHTGAPKGVMYDVLMVGDFTRFHAGNFPCFSLHNYRGFLTGLQQTVMS